MSQFIETITVLISASIEGAFIFGFSLLIFGKHAKNMICQLKSFKKISFWISNFIWGLLVTLLSDAGGNSGIIVNKFYLYGLSISNWFLMIYMACLFGTIYVNLSFRRQLNSIKQDPSQKDEDQELNDTNKDEIIKDNDKDENKNNKDEEVKDKDGQNDRKD